MKKKFIIIPVIFLIIIMMFSSMVFADELNLGDLNAYKPSGSSTETFQGKVSTILGIIQIVGVILSVIILATLGVKYMFGSLEERADYKKTMIPYLIGATIVFTGTALPQLIYKFVTNF